MQDIPRWLEFWGKARAENELGPSWHPIAHHLLDVAAVTEALLGARSLVVRRVAKLLEIECDEARSLIVALAGLHDIGKFAPAFQAKSPEHWPASTLGTFDERFAVRRPHTEDGMSLWFDVLCTQLTERLWIGGDRVLCTLAPAVFGHHGRPVSVRPFSESAARRFGNGVSAASACAEAVVALLMPTPVSGEPADEDRVRIASWLVSGVLTVADWVGSNERWFPYVAPDVADPSLHAYWERARHQARRAVRDAGLVPLPPSAEREFAELTGIPGEPTPVQAWALKVPLPDGPSLFVIEDVTGAGKTEAAQLLVHRLMAAGRASGAYWAMPTMATANAMYARQQRAIGVLFAPSQDGMKPSLVLAHGQQRLHDEFRATVLRPDDVTARPSTGDGVEPDSSAACAAFLADDRRTALLADVGAGTVDQALLGALPSKFNTMRLLGLAEKVLVVDEAHAYDSYVQTTLKELLRFHAALGGSAIILSATLTKRQREALASAWADGIMGGGRQITFTGGVALASEAYPLATVVAREGTAEFPLEPASWSRRTVGVRLVHDVDAALKHVLDVARAGGAAAWVRNTVDDCLEAAAKLRALGVEPLVFHARFAQGDRQARERDVMSIFGKNARAEDRRGRVLVATQVIEQSLDLDFDAMVSDVAPIDLLVQRAGRLWRHQSRADAGRPDGLRMELVVLSPEPAAEPSADWLGGPFKGTAKVYPNAGMLWRTVRALSEIGCITTPEGLRHLIESALDRDGHVPVALEPKTRRAEGEDAARASVANDAVLKANSGYHGDAVPWADDMKVPTRLGDGRTAVRLARIGPGGTIVPWASAETPWKAWALSEVRVSSYRIPEESRSDPRHAAAVERVRATWGKYEQDVPVVVLEPAGEGRWLGSALTPDGKVCAVGYTHGEGLDFPADQRPSSLRS